MKRYGRRKQNRARQAAARQRVVTRARRRDAYLDPNSESVVTLSRVGLNRSTFRFRVTGSVNDVNAGGTGTQAYAFLLNAPGSYRNPAGSTAQMGVLGTEVARAAAFFDEFKVTRMLVRYERAFSGHDIETKDNVVDERMIVLWDNDDSALLTSEAKALNSQLPYVVHNLLEPRQNSTIADVGQPSRISAMVWQNPQFALGQTSPTITSPGSLGAVKIWVFGYPAATVTRGTFYVTWELTMRGVAPAQS